MSQVIVMTPAELTSIITEAVRREVGAVIRDISKPSGTYATKEAAQYLGQSPQTLRQWRTQSRGPAYLKDRRGVRYAKSDMDAWLQANRVTTIEAPDAPRK